MIWKSNCTCPSAKTATGARRLRTIRAHGTRTGGGGSPHRPQPCRAGGASLSCQSLQLFSQRALLHSPAATRELRVGGEEQKQEGGSGWVPALTSFPGSTGRCREGRVGCAQHGSSCGVCAGAARTPRAQRTARLPLSLLPQRFSRRDRTLITIDLNISARG